MDFDQNELMKTVLSNEERLTGFDGCWRRITGQNAVKRRGEIRRDPRSVWTFDIFKNEIQWKMFVFSLPIFFITVDEDKLQNHTLLT